MTTRAAMGPIMSNDKEDLPLYFNEWIKRRRQELGLTQEQLAHRASCSVFAIRKIEMGERRPSWQLAGLLAKSLEVPPECQTTFIKAARGELSVESLRSIFPGHDAQISEEPGRTPGNLHRVLTPFIGREPELAALGQLLHDPQCSLITIVGTGGIGKTRLAIEAAQHSRDFFPDGVWFVPLASLNSPISIVPAVANTVNLKFQDPTSQQAQLLRYLRSKRALLVLDNAEHLLEGVGLFTEILQDCQRIKLLVTSRERLNLLSEWVFDLHGLPVPPNNQVEQFDTYSSVALFLQSARRMQAGFEIQEAERGWVLKICRTMEGMPLGIELSAAWVGLLSCEEIAKEIEHNLDFLSVSMRDLPERHRSLRATLDHSWKLLNAEEKVVISRLSVFHSNFSLEAAQEICGANLSVLASLKNKSLLYRTDQEFYSLHEIIRQYAELKLAEDPCEQVRVKDRHASYYVHLLSKWEKALQSSQQVETLNEMGQVIHNLSHAWQHMVTHCRPREGESNQLCADMLHSALFSISLFYEMRCRSPEAIALLKASVEYLKSVQAEFERTEDSIAFNSVLGHITTYLGLHHFYILQYEKSREYLEEAIRILENSGSRVERAQAQVMLAYLIDFVSGNPLESAALFEQSRKTFREAGEQWWYALSTIHLARIYISLAKLDKSEALLLEGFQIIDPEDLRLEVPLRISYANVLYLKGDFARAEQLMLDNLETSYRLGNHVITAKILLDLGRVALNTKRSGLAVEYIQKSIKALSETSGSRDLAMQRNYLGKCYAAQSDLPAARDQFRQAIKIGQEFAEAHQVYFGLVNIARTYLEEGQTGKALEICLALMHYPIEYKSIQNENVDLLEDLKAVVPEEQVEAVMKQVNGEIPAERAEAAALAYALDRAAR